MRGWTQYYVAPSLLISLRDHVAVRAGLNATFAKSAVFIGKIRIFRLVFQGQLPLICTINNARMKVRCTV